MNKRKREEEEEEGIRMGTDIVWQTPANPPHPHDYIFRNGIRYVKPYYFEFIAHVKNRWAGKTIVDLFAQEFKGRPYEYYVSAVKCGRIQVDGERVSVSYIVKSSQKISHFVHRHEPPVMACEVPILQKELDVLTVCKPASVPIEGGLVRKKYIARVVGEFPKDELVVDANIDYNAREGRSTAEVRDSAKGKAASTKFTRISSNGAQSIVLCEPITGRTHQIRVHLKHSGHPIANDMLYISDETVDRSSKGSSADRSACTSATALTSSIEEKVVNDCEEKSNVGFSIDPMCTNCPNLAPKGYDTDEEGLWLHCIQYSGPDWTYECPYPDWAKLTQTT
ncbi:RNA pseudouridine synthase 7 isoform X5 [Arachis ipaensis]|uniref:RNA pseudouridine synthase 7 isoform X5 n=1 Tax=Arachis ipaensis TaxID=130454 RepID=UPI000A2B537E|nr:RNA pseudouridine synthase 7 isoform X5 [Arachis ipaensis]XP_025671638.1 RNA pseudouridine synthase 7 isoform X2 [Arachis hypogaea]